MRAIALVFILLIGGLFDAKAVEAAVAYDVAEINQQRLHSYRSHQLFSIRQYSPNEIQAVPASEWQLHQSTHKDFAVQPGGMWFKFQLTNSADSQQAVAIVVQNRPSMIQLQAFQQSEVGFSPLALQPLGGNNRFIAELAVPAKQQITFYLWAESEIALSLPVTLYQQHYLLKQSNQRNLQNGFALGGMLCLTLVMLTILVINKSRRAAYLLIYFVARTLLLASLLGFNLSLFWPEFVDSQPLEFTVLTILSLNAFLWFAYRIFDLSKSFPHYARIVRLLCWLLLLYLPISLALTKNGNIVGNIICFTAVMVALSLMSISFVRQKIQQAKLFSLIVGIQLLIAVVAIIGLSWYESWFFEHQDRHYLFNFWLNGLLICFLLSRQYHIVFQERQLAQQEALTNALASQKAQQELLTVQQESQELLEQNVQERTLELNIALRELEQVNQELAEKNTKDELTGLHNRRYYDQKILAEYRRSKRNLTPLSLLIIDIDHFKKVNDTYGHQAGDYCIEWVAGQIKQSLKRSGDVGCRYGGEEFCLILPDTDTQGAVAVAEELRQRIEKQNVHFQDTVLSLTISCGVACYQQQTYATVEAIFASADKALYQSKLNGRNQTQYIAIAVEAADQEQINE